MREPKPLFLAPRKIELTFEQLPEGKAKLHYEETFGENQEELAENTVLVANRTFPGINARADGSKVIMDHVGERQTLAHAVIGEFLGLTIENERDVLKHIHSITETFLKGFFAREPKPEDLKMPEIPPEIRGMTVKELLEKEGPPKDIVDRGELAYLKLMVEKGVISMDDTVGSAAGKMLDYKRKMLKGLRK